MKNNEKNKSIILFQSEPIRRVWDEEKEKWYFSVVDIIAVLTKTDRPRKYWDDLKRKLGQEGSQLSEKIGQLKLMSNDGKKYLTDVADTETMLRIIQSVPSPNAEPFKLWLAKVGYERVQEIENPELAMDRMKAIYEKKGYPKEWIDKRSRGIAVRHSLTDEWKNRGAKNSLEYAILTNEIMESAFDLKVGDYKKLKGLKRENLRDHMDDMELILTMLGEATTTRFTRERDSAGLEPLKKDARDGGAVAGRTRKDIEKQSGRKIVSKKNFLPKPQDKLLNN